jgi:hypothetical protein
MLLPSSGLWLTFIPLKAEVTDSSKMLVLSTKLYKSTFQNVGTIYQTTQEHFPKCRYYLPNYTRALSKTSVPPTKQHGVTSQNIGTIYQTILLYTKINVPSTKLQSIPKYLYHLPNYRVHQNISTTYQTTALYPKIVIPSTKLVL